MARPRFVPRLIASFAAVLVLFCAASALAQSPPPPIQDNSFLVEEAYNQERGVVQTVFTFQRVNGSPAYVSTLTQEWPAPGQNHQISLTLPLQGAPSQAGVAQGFGDAALNYRFQLVGDGKSPVAFSPRLTLLAPTGNADRALGAGGVGAQANLPLSVVLSPALVSHTNLGATHYFSARTAAGESAPLTSWNAGQSLVWLARPDFNVLLEAVLARNEVFADEGGTTHTTEAWVSPGVRFAVNLPGQIQIVPGVAVPIGVGPSRGKTGLFLYLSVELPFWGGKD
ncbi:MAG: transporter [Acidobacteriota bacterium]